MVSTIQWKWTRADGSRMGVSDAFSVNQQKQWIQAALIFKKSIILIVLKSQMSKRQVLQDQYSQYLGQVGSKNGEACLFQFREILQSFLQNDQQNSSNLNFLSSHLYFLFQSISKPNPSSNCHFTIKLQVLNYLLRSSPQYQFKIPINLIYSLSDQLNLNQAYKNSMNVIANVVWLICRCLQVTRNRELFMRLVSKSNILEHCIESKFLNKQTQKGLMILASYMCKRELEQQQIYLTLLRNIQKFTEAQLRNEVFGLLRRNKALQVIQSNPKCLLQHLNKEQVAQHFILQNYSLLVLAAKPQELDFQLLKIQKVLLLLIQSEHNDAEKVCLKKVYRLLQKLFQNQDKIHFYLNLSLPTIYSNPISRRIFIQYHEKITYKQFLDILRGDYPKRLETSCLSAEEGSNRLKSFICMKRIASRLGLNSFYNFKLRPLAQRLILKQNEAQLNSELIELLKEITENQQNIVIN